MAETPKPNKRNILKWVKGLESDEHKQGKGNMEWNGYNCCLGVACRVAQKNGVEVEASASEYLKGVITFNGARCFLPTSVRGWLGLPSDPLLTSRTSCTYANDDLGWSFKKIAKALRKRYLEEN